MIELQSLTGMRPGEATVMRCCDLDTSGRVWVYRPQHHNTEIYGHKREIYLGPRAQEVLRPWLRPNLEEHLFQPREAREARYRKLRATRQTPVQPSQVNRRKRHPQRLPGERYNTLSYARAIRRACLLAKVPVWAPNRLRHNAATRLRKEYGIELARIILGHTTAFTTEIYAEADRAQAMEVIGKVG
jgi:integrase